jgi:hypothetical protein
MPPQFRRQVTIKLDWRESGKEPRQDDHPERENHRGNQHHFGVHENCSGGERRHRNAQNFSHTFAPNSISVIEVEIK